MPELLAHGQIRANPHLRPDADTTAALRAIEEELTRHAAQQGRYAEIRDAVEEMQGAADEGLTWRLKQAADATHHATAQPLADAGTQAEAETRMSADLQGLIDRQIWKKPPRR
jgi:DNA primase